MEAGQGQKAEADVNSPGGRRRWLDQGDSIAGRVAALCCTDSRGTSQETKGCVGMHSWKQRALPQAPTSLTIKITTTLLTNQPGRVGTAGTALP